MSLQRNQAHDLLLSQQANRALCRRVSQLVSPVRHLVANLVVSRHVGQVRSHQVNPHRSHRDNRHQLQPASRRGNQPPSLVSLRPPSHRHSPVFSRRLSHLVNLQEHLPRSPLRSLQLSQVISRLAFPLTSRHLVLRHSPAVSRQVSHRSSQRVCLRRNRRVNRHVSRLCSRVGGQVISPVHSRVSSVQPSDQPTSNPTCQPSSIPSSQPSLQPSSRPSSHPSSQPSSQPSTLPTLQPTAQPSCFPTRQPSVQPTLQPSSQPSSKPSNNPSSYPSSRPTCQPSTQPSVKPSSQPSSQPSCKPSSQPSAQPSRQPSKQPTTNPSSAPWFAGSSKTIRPTLHPTVQPSQFPSRHPTFSPTFSVLSTWLNTVSSIVLRNVSSSSLRQASFVQLVMNSQVQEQYYGGCRRWRTFLFGTLPSYQLRCKVESISIFDTYDIDGSDFKFKTCQDISASQRIVSVLANVTMTVSQTVSILCDVDMWVIRTCDASLVPALCLNCSNPCSNRVANSCPVSNAFAASRIFDPCRSTTDMLYQTCVSPATTFANGLVANFVPLQPALIPVLTSHQVWSSRKSITVSLTLSSDGYVRCGVFPNTFRDNRSVSLFSLSDIDIQGKGAFTVNRLSNFSFPDLLPSTNYSVFCYGEGPDGTKESLSVVQARHIYGRTFCCRKVEITILQCALLQGTQYLDIIKVQSAEMRSEDNLVVSLALINTIDVTNRLALFPNQIQLTANHTVAYFTVPSSSTTIPGKFLLKHNVYDVDISFAIDSIDVVYVANDSITIAATSDELLSLLRAPRLMHAKFASDASSVFIAFDPSTNKGNISRSRFPCKQLFVLQNGSSDILSQASSGTFCIWSDESTVQLITGPDLSVAPGQLVSVLANRIQPKCLSVDELCASYPYAAQQGVSITATDINFPRVVLKIADIHNPCQPLIIDYSASSGSANQPWRQQFFAVIVTLPSNNISSSQREFASSIAANITRDLNSVAWRFGQASIPNTYLQVLPESASISIALTLCTFLNTCSQASKSVFLSSTITPIAQIGGESVRIISRSNNLQIRGDAYVPFCQGDSIRAVDLQYSWSVSLSGTSAAVPISSVSLLPNYFVVPTNLLAPGTWYDIELTVLYTVTNRAATVSVAVYVERGPIVAVIKGGSTTVQHSDTVVTFDGSLSYDADEIFITTAFMTPKSQLIFSWSCTQVLPIVSNLCPFQVLDVRNYTSTWQVYIPPNSAGKSGRISLEVSKSDGRSSLTSISVNIRDANSPVISLKRISVSSVVLTSKDNVNSPLALVADITASNLSSLSWFCNDTSVSLANSGERVSSPDLQQWYYQKSLILPPFSFAAGGTYLFTLAASSSDGNHNSFTSVSSIVVYVNNNPNAGIFLVEPGIGVELQTQFIFSAQFWTDDDLPLLYAFGYITPVVQQPDRFQRMEDFQLLRYASELSMATLPLACVNADSSNRTTARAVLLVYDNLMSKSNLTKEVVVERSSNLSILSLEAYLLSVFNSVSSSRDNYYSALSTGITVINQVSCAQAPTCANANRQGCSTVANTCGECLQGYLGEEGHSNTQCFVLADEVQTLRRVSFLPSSFHLRHDVDQLLCSSDMDCPMFQHCESASRSCIHVQKQCLSDCSGHGACAFLPTFYANQMVSSQLVEIPTCSIDNIYCEEKCICFDGYASFDCSLPLGDLAVRISTRFILLQQLKNMAEFDISTSIDTLISFASSLSATTSQADQLNSSSIALSLQVLNATLDGYLLYRSSESISGDVLDYSDLNSVLPLLSNIISYTKTDTSMNKTDALYYLEQVTDCLSVYLLLIFSTFSVGERSYTEQLKHLSVVAQPKPTASFPVGVNAINYTFQTIVLSARSLEIYNNLLDSQVSISYPNISVQPLHLALFSFDASLFPVARNGGVDINAHVAVHVLQVGEFTSRPFIVFTSNYSLTKPTYIQVEDEITSRCSGSNMTSTCEVNIMLPFFQPRLLPSSSIKSQAHTTLVQCPFQHSPGNNLIINMTVECPNSESVTLQCNSTSLKNFLVTCPYAVGAPVCQQLYSRSPSVLSSCAAIQYDSQRVTCRCSISSIASLASFNALGGVWAREAVLFIPAAVLAMDQAPTEESFWSFILFVVAPVAAAVIFLGLGLFIMRYEFRKETESLRAKALMMRDTVNELREFLNMPQLSFLPKTDNLITMNDVNSIGRLKCLRGLVKLLDREVVLLREDKDRALEGGNSRLSRTLLFGEAVEYYLFKTEYGVKGGDEEVKTPDRNIVQTVVVWRSEDLEEGVGENAASPDLGSILWPNLCAAEMNLATSSSPQAPSQISSELDRREDEGAGACFDPNVCVPLPTESPMIEIKAEDEMNSVSQHSEAVINRLENSAKGEESGVMGSGAVEVSMGGTPVSIDDTAQLYEEKTSPKDRTPAFHFNEVYTEEDSFVMDSPLRATLFNKKKGRLRRPSVLHRQPGSRQGSDASLSAETSALPFPSSSGGIDSNGQTKYTVKVIGAPEGLKDSTPLSTAGPPVALTFINKSSPNQAVSLAAPHPVPSFSSAIIPRRKSVLLPFSPNRATDVVSSVTVTTQAVVPLSDPPSPSSTLPSIHNARSFIAADPDNHVLSMAESPGHPPLLQTHKMPPSPPPIMSNPSSPDVSGALWSSLRSSPPPRSPISTLPSNPQPLPLYSSPQVSPRAREFVLSQRHTAPVVNSISTPVRLLPTPRSPAVASMQELHKHATSKLATSEIHKAVPAASSQLQQPKPIKRLPSNSTNKPSNSKTIRKAGKM
ncbi:hypothetical protein EON64_01885 [archaeon]|nr:MAG: hypothetical protein EON64_01885 [archaeon]